MGKSNNKKLFLVLLIVVIGFCFFCFYIFRDVKIVSSSLPVETVKQFMETLIELKKEGNNDLLSEVFSEEALLTYKSMGLPFDMDFSIESLEFLEISYNYKMTFENGLYFYFWLDYKDEKNLQSFGQLSREDVLAQFYITRISELYLPDSLAKDFLKTVFDAAENKDEEKLQDVTTNENILKLYELLPYFDQVHNVTGLDGIDNYNYRVMINKKDYYYVDVVITWPSDILISSPSLMSDEELINSLHLEKITSKNTSE